MTFAECLLIYGSAEIQVFVDELLEVPSGYYEDGPARPWRRWRDIGPRSVIVAPSLWEELAATIHEVKPHA